MITHIKIIPVFPLGDGSNKFVASNVGGNCPPFGTYEILKSGQDPKSRAVEACMDFGFTPDSVEVIQSMPNGDEKYLVLACLVPGKDRDFVQMYLRSIFGEPGVIRENDFQTHPEVANLLKQWGIAAERNGRGREKAWPRLSTRPTARGRRDGRSVMGK